MFKKFCLIAIMLCVCLSALPAAAEENAGGGTQETVAGGDSSTQDGSAEQKQGSLPKVVYTGGREILTVYPDGTIESKDVNSEGTPRMITPVAESDGYFYTAGSVFDAYRVQKIGMDGEAENYDFDPNAGMYLQFAQDGYQYYNAKGYIVRVNEKNMSDRKTLAKGQLHSIEGTYIRNNEVWFTDVDGDYAIYKLSNGKKTKLSSNDSYIKHVNNGWIYYQYYENNRWALYRMTLNGTHKNKLSGDADVAKIYIANNKIYYLDNRSKALREMNLDGTGKRAICKLRTDGVDIFAAEQGKLYFTEEQHPGKSNQQLYLADLKTGKKKLLVNIPLGFDYGWVRIKNVEPIGDYVAYSVANEVFVTKQGGTSPKKVATLGGAGAGRDLLHYKVN
ncbi:MULTISPECIES: DUF5050 domain-containing protein [Paenibacillus]|uniref:DUF5050 domain-containing protein n=1 Tax=Paenibacillus TaxID=44249 RepID=UPI002FE34B36